MEFVLLAAFAGCSTALTHSLTTLDGECGALSEEDAGVLQLRDFLRNSDQDLWRSGEESPETALYFDGMEALMRAQNTYTNASKRNEELYLAARRFSMALLFRPDVSMLWHNLGTCILGLRQHWTAIPLWERAIELDPDNELARQALDETMEELDRLNFETRPEDVGGTLLGSRFDGELFGAKLTNMSKFTRMTDDDIMSRFDLGDRCDLEVVDAKYTSPDDFYHRFIETSTPAVLDHSRISLNPSWMRAIQSGVSSSPATEFLMANVNASWALGANHYVKWTEGPKKYLEGAAAIGEDYTTPEQLAPYYRFSNETDNYKWILTSAAGSGSCWHVDLYNTSAWNFVVTGRKRWALYPPEQGVPKGLDLLRNKPRAPVNFQHYVGTDELFLERWIGGSHMVLRYPPLLYFDQILQSLRGLERPFECMLSANQTIFVPGGWWHTVLNTEASVAITENFVTRATEAEYLSETAAREALRMDNAQMNAILGALSRDRCQWKKLGGEVNSFEIVNGNAGSKSAAANTHL